VVLPEADVASDEEPLEDASIEEVGEEGDFLEDFPDNTEVACDCLPPRQILTPHEGSRTRPCSHWLVGQHAITTVCGTSEKTVSPPELYLIS
jgi:hypothetical protein